MATFYILLWEIEMNKNIFLLFFVCALLFSPFVFAEDPDLESAKVGKWTMDLKAAWKLAKQKNIPVLLNFTGSDWCYWCKLMDKGVFAKKEWHKYARKNIILVTIDFPRNANIVPKKYIQRNQDLKKKYKIRGYPTYLLLTPQQKVIGKLGASRTATPAWFIKEIQFAILLSDSNYKSTLSKEQAKSFEQLFQKFNKAKQAMQAFIKTRPRRTPANVKKYFKLQEGITKAKQNIIAFYMKNKNKK